MGLVLASAGIQCRANGGGSDGTAQRDPPDSVAVVTTNAPLLATTVPTTQPAKVAPPSTFVALTTDGRVAVVSTATDPVRYLTEAGPGGGPSGLALSADRQSAYLSRGSGTCSASLVRVPLEAGAGEPVAALPGRQAGDINDAPTPRPAAGQLAFSRYYCDSRVTELVIAGTGSVSAVERRHAGLTPLAWSAGGDRLLALDDAPRSLVVLDVNAAGDVTARRPVPDAADGCVVSGAAFSARAGRIVVARTCPPDASARSRLLEIDQVSGGVERTLVTLAAGMSFQGGLSFDASLVHLLFVTNDGAFRLDGETPVRVAPAGRYRDAAW